MNYLSKLYHYFTSEKSHKNKVDGDEIQFAKLIENIHKNIYSANESLECVGNKYIEKFFEKTTNTDEKKSLFEQFQVLEKEMVGEENAHIDSTIKKLKLLIEKLCRPDEKDCIYRPVMTVFEMPELKGGIWQKKQMEIPLFAVAGYSMPKLKELTFTSTLSHVKNKGDDVYVRLHNKQEFQKNEDEEDTTTTKVKISFSPEQSLKELNKVINQYKKILQPDC